MNITKKKINQIIEYALLIVSGWIFLLLTSSWTSPLFKNSYGYDSAFFSMMGRAVLEGKVPYRDYFDLKGPVFFFMEAIGQLICHDRMGVFFLQLISISATVVLLYKIALIYLKKWQSRLIIALFYLGYSNFLWGGNTVEELCLPINLLCIYIGIRFMEEDIWEEVAGPAFCFGISFGIIFLSKMTVAAPMIGMMLTLMVLMISRKRWVCLIKCFVFFLMGMLMVAIPTGIYFWLNGAFDEMIFSVFIFAFRRSTDYYEGFSLNWEKKLLICYVAFFCLIFIRTRKKYEKILIGSIAVITFLLLHLGTPFEYYFITTLPLLAIVLIYFMRSVEIEKSEPKNIWKIVGMEFGICLILISYLTPAFEKYKENYQIIRDDTESEYYYDCKEMCSLIPEWERENIYCLESGMIWYEVNQLLPANRYPVNCPYFISLNPPFKEDILNTLNKETPKWLISEKIGEFDDADVKIAVYQHYKVICSNSAGQLFLRIE